MTYSDDTLVWVVGVGDDVYAEEGVDTVLGVEPAKDHPEVPRVDREASQDSPSTFLFLGGSDKYISLVILIIVVVGILCLSLCCAFVTFGVVSFFFNLSTLVSLV